MMISDKKSGWLFKIILSLSAFLVAGAAAFFSITGLSKLFAGSALAIIIMASSLEIAKLVVASYLYRYWTTTSKHMRFYLSFSLGILMLITSIGIYGFLSSAYENTSNDLRNIESKRKSYQFQIVRYERDIKTFETRIDELRNQSTKLETRRTSQEVRLDSLYFSDKKRNTSIRNLEKYNQSIDSRQSDIQIQLDVLNRSIINSNDSISKYNNLINEQEIQTNNSDLGPLKYLSRLFDVSMDVIVNILILLIIFVFDPLAIALVITFNKVVTVETEEKKQIEEKLKEPEKQKEKELEELYNSYKRTKEPIPDISFQTKQQNQSKGIKSDGSIIA